MGFHLVNISEITKAGKWRADEGEGKRQKKSRWGHKGATLLVLTTTCASVHVIIIVKN